MPAWLSSVRNLFKRITDARHPSLSVREEKTKAGEAIGIYLDPFETNFVLRPIVSIVAAMLATLLLYGLQLIIGSDVLPSWAAIPIMLLLTLFFALNDKKPITVHKQYVAILTFLGMRFNIYFEEGDHYWYGGKVGIGYSTEPLPNSSDGKYIHEKSGFVYVGNRPIGIWPNMDAKEQYRLSNVTRSSSTLYNTLTITFRIVWPLRYANSDDPILDIAERSRSALRTLVSFFVGADNAMLKSVSSKLLEGKCIVTAFLFRPVEGSPAGSVIQDRSGGRIFKIIEDDEDLEVAKKRVRERIDAEAPSSMREAVLHNGTPEIHHLKIVDHLIPVLTANGAHFEHASVSDVSLSDEEAKQANIAAGENYQRVAQIENAKTIKAAREIMAEGVETEEGQFATIAALARDGHADIVFVPNSDKLTRAAVAGAKQIGGKK